MLIYLSWCHLSYDVITITEPLVLSVSERLRHTASSRNTTGGLECVQMFSGGVKVV